MNKRSNEKITCSYDILLFVTCAHPLLTACIVMSAFMFASAACVTNQLAPKKILYKRAIGDNVDYWQYR